MEDRYRQLFEVLPEALLLRNADGAIAEANAAAGDLFRCDVAELVGRRLQHLADDLDDAVVDERLAALAPGESLTISVSGRHAEGGTFPLQLVLTPTGGDTLLLARDLSESRRLEAGVIALAELARIDIPEDTAAEIGARAMNACRQLLDADRAAICAIYDSDQKVEWLASHRLEALIAASADLRPDEVPWLKRALASGRPEVIDRRAASHQRSGLSQAADALGISAFAIVPLQLDERTTGALGLVWSDEPPETTTNLDLLATIGRLVGLALSNARQRGAIGARERALDESEARYRTLFEEAPQAMVIATWDGQLLEVNRAAERLFGHTRDSLIGRGGDQLWRMTREQRAALLSELRRDRSASTTATGVRADGTLFRQLMTVSVTAFRGEERLLIEARDGGPASA